MADWSTPGNIFSLIINGQIRLQCVHLNKNLTKMAQNTGAKEEGQTIVEEKVVKFNGDICIKKYLKGKFLGKGGFAKCYEMTNLENKKV